MYVKSIKEIIVNKLNKTKGKKLENIPKTKNEKNSKYRKIFMREQSQL